MKKTILALATTVAGLVSGFPNTASAQPLMNYTYADVAYQWTHFDESWLDNGNGLDVQLSFSPIQHFALEGGYNYLKTGSSNVVPDLTVTQNWFTYGGAGWYSLQEGLDIVARVGGIHARSRVEAFDMDGTASDNGVYTGLTLRYLATEALETDLFVSYDRVDTGAWTYGLTGLYALHENVALKGEAAINDDSDVALLAGIRLAM
jgi:hypothetical protein